MATLLVTHPCFVLHDTGTGPSGACRTACGRSTRCSAHEAFQSLKRAEAPLRDDVEAEITLAHPTEHLERMRRRGVRQGPSAAPHRRRHGRCRRAPGRQRCARSAPGSRPSTRSWPARRRTRSARCARPGITPRATARWASACSRMRPSRAFTRARATAPSASPSSISTFTTATARRTSSGRDKNLFYGSTHQMPLFPGTGALSETGVGNIWNAPLRAGDGGETFREAFTGRILGPLAQFRPRHRHHLGRIRCS